MTQRNRKISDKEVELIDRIADRAVKLELSDNQQEVCRNVTAVHKNDTALDLQKLLDSDDFHFAHDICGIRKHMSAETGKLKCGFLLHSSLSQKNK